MKRAIYIVISIFVFSINAISQDYTEYYFKFNIQDRTELDVITEIISIDNVKGLEVFAYANQQEFDEFKLLNYKIEFLEKDIPKSITMATTVAEMANWDRYPTYEVYREMMKNFESNYPLICKLDSFGTTTNGRKLYALKISDNITIEENEPEFFYTSTMHGDETTGFILLLRLADSLLSQYGSEAYITNLVDEIDIYINPNANPDGTYYGGNSTVASARRYNANGYDINRNFPDPRTGENSSYQIETQAMMDFAHDHNFVMAANFHGGVEVMNYPWDTWSYSSNPHSDTEWFEKVCTDYVDTARTVKSTYMTSLYSDGVTHGATWYQISGGRQDYMNFWHQCREVTIEVSLSKLLATESLNNYWNINKRSLLYYLNECLMGVRGLVTNELGEPLNAMIWIENHDNFDDSSMVYTDTDIGNYHRLIEPGTYNITASSNGYLSQTAENIDITLGNTSLLNFILTNDIDSILLKIDPNLINDTLFFNQIEYHDIIISNDFIASSTSYDIEIENAASNTWLELNKSTGTIIEDQNDTTKVTINADLLDAGEFSTNILITSADLIIDTIPVSIIVHDTISFKVEPEEIIDTLFNNQTKAHNIIVSYDGPATHALYDVEVENEVEDFWLELNKISGTIWESESDTSFVTINADLLDAGKYNANILLSSAGSNIDTIPVNITVHDTISFNVEPETIIDTLFYNQIKTHNIIISNDGPAANALYDITIENNVENYWLELNENSGTLLGTDNDTIFASINADLTSAGYYSANIILSSIDENIDTIPVNILIKDTISTLINPKMIIDTLWGGNNKAYDIIIKNDGLLSFDYTIQIDEEVTNDWISLNKSSGSLLITNSDTIKANVVTADNGFGNLVCDIIIQKENSDNDTIPIHLFVKDTIVSEIYPLSITDTLDSEISKQYPVVIKNIGYKNLEYTSYLEFPIKSDIWIIQDKYDDIINPEQTDTIILTVNTHDLITGNYVCELSITENDGLNTSIPINIFVNQIQSIENKPVIDYFYLYPNPFNDNLNIHINHSDYKRIKLHIYNISGSTIFTKEIDLFGKDENTISLNDYFDVNQIPTGIYFMQISTIDFLLTKKVIKN